MANSPDDDDRLDLERTDELPVLMESMVVDASDSHLGLAASVDDTSEHTAHFTVFGAAESAAVEELKNDLAERGAKIAALETDIARLTARWHDVEQHLSTKDAEIAALKRIVDDVGAALNERQQAEQKLVADLAERDTLIARLREELASLRDTSAPRIEYARLEDDLRAARDEAAALRTELGAAKAAATDAANEAALRDTIATLERELEKTRAVVQEHDSRIAAVTADNASLQRELQASTAARERAENIVRTEAARATALRAELVKHARLVETLQRDLATRRAAEAEPHHSTLALRAELAAAREQAARAEADLKTAQAEHASAIEALDKQAADERAALETELAAARRQGADVATVSPPLPAFEIIAQLEAEVEFKRQQVNAQLVALRERDQRIAESEQALEQIKSELADARSTLDTARDDNGRLERALVERDRAVEAKEARISALEEELNQRLGALQKLNAIDVSLQGLDSRMSERLRQSDKLPVDNLNIPALVCLTGDAPKQVALTKPRNLIGRGEHCDIQILTHFVSREHARINIVRGSAVIEDLGSTNGVFVNSVRVDRHELRQGDLITVGETQFRFLESMAH